MNMQDVTKAVEILPFKGVDFVDIESITGDRERMSTLIQRMASRSINLGIDVVVGLDARGLPFAAAIADAIGAGFRMARKPGKLPGELVSVSYTKEYKGDNDDGTETLAMRANSESMTLLGKRVLIVDDLLATGGTARAACELVEKLGGEVIALQFVVELSAIPTPGRAKLLEYAIISEICILSDGKAYTDVEQCTDVLPMHGEDLLLIERLNNEHGLAMVGGRIELGHTVRQTAEFESIQETGYSVGDIEFLGMLATPNRDPRGQKVSVVVTAKVTGGKARGEHGKTRVVFHPQSQLLPIHRFAFDHGQVVRGYLETLTAKAA